MSFCMPIRPHFSELPDEELLCPLCDEQDGWERPEESGMAMDQNGIVDTMDGMDYALVGGIFTVVALCIGSIVYLCKYINCLDEIVKGGGIFIYFAFFDYICFFAIFS